MLTQKIALSTGIEMFYLEDGLGPLLILCLGWPEFSFAWHHKIPALASAGFRVVAPDMRGYGYTSAPKDVDAYSIFDIVCDIAALVASLSERRTIIVGHDWGAAIAWHAVLFPA